MRTQKRNSAVHICFKKNNIVSEILVFFLFYFISANEPKTTHSYLFCCGCAFIQHDVEQSLWACGSEPNGGRELFDLLKKRRRREKRI